MGKFVLMVLLLIAGANAQAAGEHCKRTFSHSNDQIIRDASLVYRSSFDAFMPASLTEHCKSSFGSDLVGALTNSCRQYGGAKAEVKVEMVRGSSRTVLARYQAFCQDLAPDLYRCTKFDKTLNRWVSVDDPSCYYGGGEGGGEGGGGEGGGGGGEGVGGNGP